MRFLVCGKYIVDDVALYVRHAMQLLALVPPYYLRSCGAAGVPTQTHGQTYPLHLDQRATRVGAPGVLGCIINHVSSVLLSLAHCPFEIGGYIWIVAHGVSAGLGLFFPSVLFQCDILALFLSIHCIWRSWKSTSFFFTLHVTNLEMRRGVGGE